MLRNDCQGFAGITRRQHTPPDKQSAGLCAGNTITPTPRQLPHWEMEVEKVCIISFVHSKCELALYIVSYVSLYSLGDGGGEEEGRTETPHIDPHYGLYLVCPFSDVHSHLEFLYIVYSYIQAHTHLEMEVEKRNDTLIMEI